MPRFEGLCIGLEYYHMSSARRRRYFCGDVDVHVAGAGEQQRSANFSSPCVTYVRQNQLLAPIPPAHHINHPPTPKHNPPIWLIAREPDPLPLLDAG
jgi:hypothetical protein